MSEPEIDVLIPVYNSADTLDQSLASIALQNYSAFRVIAVDDGSTDASPAILARWAARDSRFMTITQANAGIVAALNAGLAAASAPLIARMDGDDLCHPDRFRIQRDYLAAHGDVVALAGRVDHIDENGDPVSGLPQPGDPARADHDWIPAREPYLIHPFLMARRQAMVAAGGYRHVPHSEDSDLYWRLREQGRLVNVSDTLGKYRLHSHSISGSILNGRIMAVGSQLGAFAARCRAGGGPDAGFAQGLVPRLKEAASLETMCDMVGGLIDAGEDARFRLSVGIKFLELAGYRPYEPDGDDCRFIRKQVDGAVALALRPENLREIRWYLGETAARLLRAGRKRDAMHLAPATLWPKMLAKSVLR